MWYLLLFFSCYAVSLNAQLSVQDRAIARYYRSLEPSTPKQWQGYPVWQQRAGPFAAIPDCSILDKNALRNRAEVEHQQTVTQIELGWWWQTDRYHWVYRIRLLEHPDCWLYYHPCTGHWLEYYCKGE